RIKTFEPEVFFGSCDKEGHGLIDSVKPGEIEIAPIHEIEGTRFQEEIVENIDIVNFAMGNKDNGRNISMQIQKRVQFDSAFVFAELGPWKERQAEIDGGGIQSINRLIQVHAKRIVHIKGSGAGDQNLCEVGINSPIPNLVGMGQGIARDFAADTHVVESRLIRPKTGFDISQALSIGELGKGHAKELIPA